MKTRGLGQSMEKPPGAGGVRWGFECVWLDTESGMQPVPIHLVLKALAALLSWHLAIERKSKAVFHLFPDSDERWELFPSHSE